VVAVSLVLLAPDFERFVLRYDLVCRGTAHR